MLSVDGQRSRFDQHQDGVSLTVTVRALLTLPALISSRTESSHKKRAWKHEMMIDQLYERWQIIIVE
jgi:hypothetical protein